MNAKYTIQMPSVIKNLFGFLWLAISIKPDSTVRRGHFYEVCNMYHVTWLNNKLSRIFKFNTEVISFFNCEKEKNATYPFSTYVDF